jgi:signal transduction histidine kinase/ligand-binding sensor domain-containing protein/DNA-binding response OmpR family regulator
MKTLNKLYYIILLTLLIVFSILRNAFCSDVPIPDIEFKHITIKDGLPNNRVDFMLQDHEGYIWFGTKRGLCRYNGYEFVTYKSQPGDSSSLRYHQISSLFEDSHNTLWIGTNGGGLHFYNRKNNSFTYVRIIPNSPAEASMLIISSIIQFSKDEIWVVHSRGLTRINITSKNIISFKNINSPNELPGQITTLFHDNSGVFYIAIRNKQLLYYYDIEEDKIKPLEWISKSKTHPEVIHQFYSYDKDNLWLATNRGLFNLNKDSNRIYHIYKNSPNTGTNINFILKDYNNNIWLGGEGLFLYNTGNKQFHKLKSNSDNPESIDGNIITCGLSDSQKNLWFGTFSRGVNVIYYKTKHFNPDKSLTQLIEGLSKNITAIYGSRNRILLLGTWDKGLIVIDNKNNVLDIGKTYPKMKFLSKKIIRTISGDKNRDIWIGTNDGLLIKCNMESGLFKTYKMNPITQESENNAIISILFSSKSKIWVAGDAGVFILDTLSNTFHEKRYKNLTITTVLDMAEDKDGNIWIASYSMGLFRISENGKITHFTSDENKNYNIPEEKIVSLYRDSKDKLWIGTEFNGLFLFLPEENRFQHFTVKNGLPSNDICSIQEDYKGRLWIGTNNGLSRFNYNLNDFKNYFWNDGMDADEFHYNSNFAGTDNMQYFGCTNGIVFFNPDDIRDEYLSLPIKIENISINNGLVLEDLNGTSISEAIKINNPIELKYNQNTISFKYTTLNYSFEKNSNYAYRLINFDNEYHYVNHQRQVTYTNIPSGKYIFKVIASNNDNIWNKDGAEFSFIIGTPPWLQWWAFMIYATFFIILIYGFRYQIRHEEKMKNAIKIERIEKNQQKILTQIKLRFFTNISHEFKTPLTLIIGPLEQLITEQHGNSKLKQKLLQISLNSKRLLELINQLIDFRKMEQDVLPLHKSHNDLISTVQETMSMFSDTAIKNSITLTLNTHFEKLAFKYDSDKIKKVLNNILSNAFKYTPQGGKVTVNIDISNNVTISISDSGSGMSSEKLNRIFDRFYGDEEKNNTDFEENSSGIGLAYSKKLIELHGGKINAESITGKGTTIIISIPYDKSIDLNDVHKHKEQIITEIIPNEPKQSISESPKDINLSNSPKILIVDDDDELRVYIKSILKEYYRIDEAKDGKEGLEMAIKNDYELIVSDVMMPNMSGTSMCAKLKSDIKTSHIIIILLTAKSDIISEIKGYETGADSYIGKPFLPKQLTAVIANLLKTRQHIKEYFTSMEKSEQELIGISSQDKEFVTKTTKIIKENLSKEEFGVEELGKELALSRTHLYRKTKSLIGLSPNEYIRKIRIKTAALLIKAGDLSISEIAYEVGFKSPANFSTSFKTVYGMSPKKYKKNV